MSDLTRTDLIKLIAIATKPLNLWGVTLIEVEGTNLDLTGANLSCADLTRANLTRANLEGANLKGAILNDVIGYKR
jgi:uncharacterized protein YjbI with pentapeptide repeats